MNNNAFIKEPNGVFDPSKGDELLDALKKTVANAEEERHQLTQEDLTKRFHSSKFRTDESPTILGSRPPEEK